MSANRSTKTMVTSVISFLTDDTVRLITFDGHLDSLSIKAFSA